LNKWRTAGPSGLKKRNFRPSLDANRKWSSRWTPGGSGIVKRDFFSFGTGTMKAESEITRKSPKAIWNNPRNDWMLAKSFLELLRKLTGGLKPVCLLS
jgi:hypothetical protein